MILMMAMIGTARIMPGNAPQPAPEKQGKEDEQRTQIHALAHELGLDDHADHGVDGQSTMRTQAARQKLENWMAATRKGRTLATKAPMLGM